MGTLYSTWEWIRSTGITAYLLLFISNVAGLMYKGKIATKTGRPMLLIIHQTAGWFSLLFAFFHVLMLLFDQYISYTLSEIFIPFTANYKTIASGVGTISLYILLFLFISSDVMKKIGRKWWRAIHYLAIPGYLLAFIHGVMIGTDTGALWMVVFYSVTFVVIAMIFVIRIFNEI